MVTLLGGALCRNDEGVGRLIWIVSDHFLRNQVIPRVVDSTSFAKDRLYSCCGNF